ncbi:[Fe-Fe] hydrogenase large subunit C-terminal domain-containing protein [Clostridium sp. C2-6-12]|uniref:[Fe-Fe] hydrogenase large subunit C-terminal domain-containing protein n=1 Tax=Clostridium sp. C2-6-12 TaxID=2698832 RepID=UPI00136B1109|nr:[Fe-Fe] hydrogenase large subunit C-terminal domain-containing protein [Clostridium sp. C2-6-12]
MKILQFENVNCKNCYKCVRYCPVKAIEIKNHCAQILEEECILCGRCTIVCPQKAKEAISDVEKIKGALEENKQVVVSVAPSFSAYYHSAFSDFREALLKLNFAEVFETAEGAYLVKTEYEKLLGENPEKTYISSCCTSLNELIKKYYPKASKYLAPVITPMEAHSKLLKERYKDAVIVFVSPCISKKIERYDKDSHVDYIISFEELSEMLKDNNIEISNSNFGEGEPKYLSRKFPTHGGIIGSMKPDNEHEYISLSGYKDCVQAIEDICNHKVSRCFVEMSFCEGSCVGGPSFQRNNISLLTSNLEINKNLRNLDYSEDFNVISKQSLKKVYTDKDTIIYKKPSELQIAAILHKMGKYTEADELNCGMCGYFSCREKAEAVFAGKAEISMCLPYMKERAESFSNQILNITPNAILTVDMDLKVQQINKAASDIFHLEPKDIINQPVSRILDEFDFVNIITSDTLKTEKFTFLAEYNAYLSQVFMYDKSNSIIVCIMKNITEERQKRNQLIQKKIQAAAMADDIVDKQLRIVHEIASLLGETAAETKIAIQDLKNTIMLEDKE